MAEGLEGWREYTLRRPRRPQALQGVLFAYTKFSRNGGDANPDLARPFWCCLRSVEVTGRFHTTYEWIDAHLHEHTDGIGFSPMLHNLSAFNPVDIYPF